MKWFIHNYLEHPLDGYNPFAFPLHARGLREISSVTIITAEFDPLRDEGFEYAERLKSDGVPVILYHYEDTMHGFLGLLADPELDDARAAINKIAADIPY